MENPTAHTGTNDPLVSVIMPVYNAGPYLRAAVDSILSQTLTRFELILVEDRSTDDSYALLQTYSDPRIRLFRQEQNSGVVATANRGIAMARAPYACVMHSDDVAAPDRLEQQVAFLETHPDVVMVGTSIMEIDSNGQPLPLSRASEGPSEPAAIRKVMAWSNCIAHPTVMIRTDVYRQYGYRRNQQSQEDYDLWLRLLADGYRIGKIDMPLLQYRVHGGSITGTILRRSNPFFKKMDCKLKFLSLRIQERRWGLFETKVLFTAACNAVMGVGKNVKRSLLGGNRA